MHQGDHSDFLRNTFEVSRGFTTQHATSYEVATPLLT
jgi:hypothetical protein